ncbi:unnamed protein product [Lymnaea stagnalis]|uniref:protein-tyrosine-phosphatase n=1 Tax=Lymnaea stagnalis TaxID=6523 RepID=A0AAV2HJ74_LYMST
MKPQVACVVLCVVLAVYTCVTTAQVPPCLDPSKNNCANTTYCSERPDGSINCVPCDIACALGCDGPGPERCTSCRIGFYRPPGIVQACVECVTGFYGNNCSLRCHCLNNELCNKTSGFCNGWKCDRGYTGLPYCQETCAVNTFGLDCLNQCHCPPNDNCSIVNGDCSSGRCDPDWGGSGCQKRLPKLVLPPTLLSAACGNITLIWDAFNQSVDIGNVLVGQYNIVQKLNSTNASAPSSWETVLSIRVSPDNPKKYVGSATRGLLPDAEYNFRIDAVGIEFDKLFTQISPGTISDAYTNPCTTSPPRPSTTPAFIYSRSVFQNVTVRADNATFIYINWNVLPQFSNYQYVVYISRQLLGNGDCDNEFGTISTSAALGINDKPTGFNIPQAWSRYRISINATVNASTNVDVKENYGVDVITQAALPTGAVMNITTESRTSSEVVLTWLPPPCNQRKGFLKNYDMHLEVVNNPLAGRITYNSTVTRFRLTDLLAYTNYSIEIAYRNDAGQGPLSSKYYFVTLEGVPSSVEIVSLTPTYSNVNVTFTAPTRPNGVIVTYTVMFSQQSDFTTLESVTVAAALGMQSLLVERLKPQTTYFIKMAASTSAGIGQNGTVKSTVTLQSPPTGDAIQLTLKSNTINCLTLQWTPPTDRASNITYYVLELRRASADTSVAPVSANTNSTSITVCQLKPSTLYIVTISGFSPQGLLSRGTENFSTEHGTPPTPVAPVFVRSTYTTITVAIEPVVSEDVPVTGYQLMVEKVVARGRKKRVAGVNGYETAQLSPVNVTKRMEFIVGDNQSYGGFLNKILENNTYYMIYYVVLSTLNQNITFSFSQLKDPVLTVPFDPALAPPIPIKVTDKNISCINFAWEPPAYAKSFITGYTFSMRKTADTTAATVSEEVNSTVQSIRRCNLAPYTAYTASVVARTDNGILAVSTDIFYTMHEVPRAPVAPVFVNSTYTSITIAIQPVVLTTGPLTAYRLQVERVSVPSRRRKRLTEVPGYIAAQLMQTDVTQRMNFTIGDGKTYGGYTNARLTEQTWYTVHYVVISESSNVSYSSFSSLNPPVLTVPYVPPVSKPAEASSTDNGVIIGVIIALVIVILLIILIIALYCWWRRKNRFSPYEVQDDDHIELPPYKDDYDPSKYWSATFNLKEGRHIIVGRELVYGSGKQPHIAGVAKQNSDQPTVSFQDEFKNLPKKSKRATDNAARSNKNFNRFPHLLPYDHSLVSLKPDGSARRTYINASFIPGYKKTPAYIAAQSPYDEETVLDFWRLIYQRSIKTVVMITNIVEDNIVKCTQYWPDSTKASYGHFLLHLTDVTVFADYTVRTIEVQCTGENTSKIVKLFEFTAWPDHGVPDDPIPFLEMRYKVRRYHHDEPSPILVHCGTGMGRTGVFIAVDTLIEQYAAEGRVEVFDYVRKIRKDRPYMVRTMKQYIFIYEAVFEEFHAGNTLVDFDLKERYHNWTGMNPRTENSYLRDQFHMLESFTRSPGRDECRAGLLAANVQKNRYLDVLPPEPYRPLLQSYGGPNPTDYINALFVDGYMKKRQFIITQTPLHTTIIDFWKLVYDYNVHSIVMVENAKNEDDSCAEYWPSVTLKQFEPFFIETTAVYQQDNITIRNFKIRSTQHPKVSPRFVRQFQFNAWAQPNTTPQSKTMMMDLIDSVFDWQDEACQNEAPVLVHCQDGASHSGLFAVLSIICEKMEEDGEVDVYRTIKHCKRRRPQFVADYDQFRFCYKTLWDFINLRMPGGTFTETLGQSRNDKKYGVASLSLNSHSGYSAYGELTSDM